jgi:hypothetical protein
MSLATAVDVALELKEALTQEIDRSLMARAVLSSVRVEGVLETARQREAFNERTARLSGRLAEALGAFAASQGLADVSMAQVRQFAPKEGALLDDAFAHLRALAAKLKVVDDTNREISARALSLVKAYVSHLSPHPAAYTKHGAQALHEALTHSEHA